jgi:ABC-type transport system substrate-binding protein
MANPVGTGPYRLKEWRRGQRIVVEANPGYRGMPYVESTDPATATSTRGCAARRCR